MNKNMTVQFQEKNEILHGGDIYSEGILKGRKLIDFSSNINPLGVPRAFIEHMDEAVEALARYPDVKYRDLKANLLDYIKCSALDESNIILGNGAAEVIDLVISCFKKILIIVPSFLEYELDAKKWKCQLVYSHLDENMQLDYSDILTKLTSCDALIIGNPNNPNGGLADKEKFFRILEFSKTFKKIVIFDEAFIEFTGNNQNSFIEQIKTYDCIFIIRALTKFFALPGIRFGYGISSNIILLNKIRLKQNPWNINCFAEIAAKYVLKDSEYIDKSHKWIEKEMVYLPEKLKKIKCIEKVYKTNTNFVLCKIKGINCNKLYDYCMEKGIIIRKASNFKGLDDSYVRFAIKDRCRNDLLLRILENVEESP